MQATESTNVYRTFCQWLIKYYSKNIFTRDPLSAFIGHYDEVSGKFASMLLDIFGQTYPENTPWTVDRAKVVAYKEQVAANVAALKGYIAEALRT